MAKFLDRIEVEKMGSVVDVGTSTTPWIQELIAKNLPANVENEDIMGRIQVDLVDVRGEVREMAMRRVREGGVTNVTFYEEDMFDFFENTESTYDLILGMNIMSRTANVGRPPTTSLWKPAANRLSREGLIVVEDHFGVNSRKPRLRNIAIESLEAARLVVEVGASEDCVSPRQWNDLASFHLRGYKKE